ncbi:MAG: GspL/Epsl periplasmic domain-containing protein [Alcaligenes sp.]
MSKVLRIYVDSPPRFDQPLDYVLRDKRGKVLRRGRGSGQELKVLARSLELVLPPGMATVTEARIPSVSASRRQAVACSAVEPMCLSPIEQVWVACAPAGPSGMSKLAWTERTPLRALGEQARQIGLPIRAVYAWSAAHEQDRQGRSQTVTMPACSLLMPEMASTGGSSVLRQGVWWTLAALLSWTLVLQQQAQTVRAQMRQVQVQMEQAVRQALPHLPVIVAPLTQAKQHRDALLAEKSPASAPFDRLLMASAVQWPDLQGQVRALNFKDQQLVLSLASELPAQPLPAESELEWKQGESTRQWEIGFAKATPQATRQGAQR